MKTALILATLTVTALAVAFVPTSAALSCTQHVYVNYHVETMTGVGASASVWTNPTGLAQCAANAATILP